MYRYMSRPGALAVSPSRLASTSEAINFIISQITSNDSDTCFKGIKQVPQSLYTCLFAVCVCVCVGLRCVCCLNEGDILCVLV